MVAMAIIANVNIWRKRVPNDSRIDILAMNPGFGIIKSHIVQGNVDARPLFVAPKAAGIPHVNG
eukprot:scaffold147223_cov60-Attheya_sp.AAC.4